MKYIIAGVIFLAGILGIVYSAICLRRIQEQYKGEMKVLHHIHSLAVGHIEGDWRGMYDRFDMYNEENLYAKPWRNIKRFYEELDSAVTVLFLLENGMLETRKGSK